MTDHPSSDARAREREQEQEIRQRAATVLQAMRDNALSVLNPEHRASWTDIATLLSEIDTLRAQLRAAQEREQASVASGREDAAASRPTPASPDDTGRPVCAVDETAGTSDPGRSPVDGRVPIAWSEFGDGHDYSRTGKHDPSYCRSCLSAVLTAAHAARQQAEQERDDALAAAKIHAAEHRTARGQVTALRAALIAIREKWQVRYDTASREQKVVFRGSAEDAVCTTEAAVLLACMNGLDAALAALPGEARPTDDNHRI